MIFEAGNEIKISVSSIVIVGFLDFFVRIKSYLKGTVVHFYYTVLNDIEIILKINFPEKIFL